MQKGARNTNAILQNTKRIDKGARKNGADLVCRLELKPEGRHGFEDGAHRLDRVADDNFAKSLALFCGEPTVVDELHLLQDRALPRVAGSCARGSLVVDDDQTLKRTEQQELYLGGLPFLVSLELLLNVAIAGLLLGRAAVPTATAHDKQRGQRRRGKTETAHHTTTTGKTNDNKGVGQKSERSLLGKVVALNGRTNVTD